MRRPSLLRFVARAVAAVLCIWVVFHAGTALVVTSEVGVPDAIIMLASHEWERLPAAAALAREFPAARVLITVPRTLTPYNCYRCGDRLQWMIEEGVARARIEMLPDPVVNTHDEAIAALRSLERAPFTRLMVVTSPYHSRRALATFQAVFSHTGVSVGVLAAPSSVAEPRRWWWHDYDRRYVAYEWAGILYYTLKFGVPLEVRSAAPVRAAGG